MSIIDIALLAVLAVIVFFALRKTIRSKSSGCSRNCTACSCSCGSPDCPSRKGS